MHSQILSAVCLFLISKLAPVNLKKSVAFLVTSISLLTLFAFSHQTANAQSTISIYGTAYYRTGYPAAHVPAGGVTIVFKRYDPRTTPPELVETKTTTTEADGTYSFTEAQACSVGWIREFQAFSSEVIDGAQLQPSNTSTIQGCPNNDIQVGNLIIQKPFMIKVSGTVYLNGWQNIAPNTLIRMVRRKMAYSQVISEYAEFTRTDENGYYEFQMWSGQQEIIISGNPNFSWSLAISGLEQDMPNKDFIVPQIIKDFTNAGESCPFVPAVAKPVNISNGNMWLKQKDYSLPSSAGMPISIQRTYNSINQFDGLFGFGWSSQYDEKLIYYDQYTLRVIMPDGNSKIFARDLQDQNLYNPVTPGFYGKIVYNQDNTYTLTFKDGRTHNFNSAGKLLWQKDRNNNQTTLSYDTNGKLTGITDAFSRTLTVSTNSNGTISQISDSLGTVADYEYYPSSTLLKTVTYHDGSKYKFEYTTANGETYLATVKDALDNILETHQYDSRGRATTSEVDGGVEEYTFDYSNWNSSTPFTEVTDALNKTTKFYFKNIKGQNVLTKSEGLCGCGGGGSEVTSYEYDDKINLIKTTDALLNETTYTYDAAGNRLTMTNVLGTETYTYNSFGQMLDKTDRMNFLSRRHYDLQGNLWSLENAQGKETIFTYTSLGQVDTITDALGHITDIDYDSQGRMTQVTDANNKNTDFAYDARGRLTSATNALNFTTSYQYDLNNRLEKITYPDTKFITYDYDLAGRRTSSTDERNNTTVYAYDDAYRLISVTDALSHTTNFGYDLMSNMTSVTDALNNTTNYEYDDFSRLEKVIYPPEYTGATRFEEKTEYTKVGQVKKRIDTANRETLYEYDAAYRLVKVTDPLANFTQFEYNARGERTKVKDALNQQYTFTYDELGRQLTQSRAGSTMTYDYDAVGNQVYRSDYSGRITYYAYDNLNRLTDITYDGSTNFATYAYDDISRMTAATNQIGTVNFAYDSRNRTTSTVDVFNHEIEYTYDDGGNRTGMDLDGQTHASYVYDAINRLTELTDEENADYTFSYDAVNRLTTRVLPNGVESDYGYDDMNRLLQLKHETSAATLFNNQYSYHPTQQIGKIVELARTRSFLFDDTDRLTNVNQRLNQQIIPIENFSYDAVGNRTLSHQSSFYNYDPFNQMKDTETYSYSYDANGNRTGKYTYQDPNGIINMNPFSDSQNYDWDEENRLVLVRGREFDSVAYQYDALGRRVKTISERSETAYIYDGLDVVMDDDSITGVTIYQNAPGIDNKLKMKNSGDNQYFLTDHLGSTVALADSSGNLTDSISYDSFGNTTKKSFATRYRFTGREFDEITGLYYYRARWYDAKIGRFISEDPIGFRGGDINLYGYVKNNPINFKDPSGLDYLIFENGQMTWVYTGYQSVTTLAPTDDGILFPQERLKEVEIGRKTWNANSGCECAAQAKEKSKIPSGDYFTSPSDKETHPGGEHSWGDFSYRLHEHWGTWFYRNWYMPERDGGFHIHGGYARGTAGCIEFEQYTPAQEWLKEFDNEVQKYGKRITLYVR
jgi:RHS repeat-associated protein